MEILLDVPPILAKVLQWLLQVMAYVSSHWVRFVDHVHAIRSQLSSVLHVPPGAILPLTVVLVLFWPVLIYLVMAIAAAWGWILWLLTSIVVGMIQLTYVVYQFVMISGDICGLSVLKTYSMVRSQILNLFDRSGHSLRKSRRKVWRKRLEQAGSYENFFKIRIEPKANSAPGTSLALASALASASSIAADRAGRRRHDSALPPAPATSPPSPLAPPKRMARVRSFTSAPGRTAADAAATKETPPRPSLLRNRSFSGEANASWTMNVGGVGSASSTTALGARLQDDDDLDPVVVRELGERTADLLATTTRRLAEARRAALDLDVATAGKGLHAINALLYLLSGVVKRNHLQLDDVAVDNARSIADSGAYGLTQNSRAAIRSYYEQVELGLRAVAETSVDRLDHHDLLDRITVVRKMKHNMGRTALMLSGGGAQAMYHLGIIRALIESKQYDDIKVISGTSGGSIAAAMCATRTAAELHRDVCIPTVSTDYKGTGEQRRRNIRWFPSLMEMAAYWLKNRLLVDSQMFRETCEFYYGDVTFEEAFELTGKHVCITVSASRVGDDAAQQRLLLNHISTPHVTLASAVAASCALPGVMAPAKLFAKNSEGQLEPFEVDGVEWIDGSVQADLPFQRISTLFAVSSFIVSQTNFHIIPLLNKAHHPNRKSLYWQLFQTIEWDIRSRALKLSRLGLFPKFFGQDVSKVFKQRYHGNLTIVPQFTTMQTFGLKALSNPTVKDMEGYLKYGQIAAWPYLNAIRDMIRLEKAVEDCLMRLEDRMRAIAPELEWSLHDEIESIASGSAVNSTSRNGLVRIVGRPPLAAGSSFRGVDRESERTRKRLSALEEENDQLRKELEQLRKLVGSSPISKSESRDEGDDHPDEQQALQRAGSMSDGSEGAVWGLVLRRKSSRS